MPREITELNVTAVPQGCAGGGGVKRGWERDFGCPRSSFWIKAQAIYRQVTQGDEIAGDVSIPRMGPAHPCFKNTLNQEQDPEAIEING